MLHQLGVLELLVQHSALLLRLTARMAAAAAAAAAQQAPPKQDSHSSDAAETVCLADDAASQCCRSGRCKRACLSADGGSKIDSQPAAKKACHRPVSKVAQPLACTPAASAVRVSSLPSNAAAACRAPEGSRKCYSHADTLLICRAKAAEGPVSRSVTCQEGGSMPSWMLSYKLCCAGRESSAQ